ncbi:nucleotide exchange factor GrpE [Microbacterium sp. zg.Y1090]|uniref:nucleotide exchange factor GrpE n=1 Tax=Microbacterium TaxID=33882 RepID=UPI00214CDE17|nr:MULTISPECIES: nucleotide exchange factor GrpE [unclassified Microbacterium]MCR2813934.1 nucleotide exchange factor GrpE [Microbacterium sp. zg.Y1084]MCR2819208.1 nucleotide exchange factor GrpE [Microbacterium sp. zg.Y1090]MDL5487117.1 nucleotide exchange factor GrpE [Microbacterium sp. zg-Y1211]WIM28192.1 nucleotide exchange factor GrpE [Microbacterium sp. zg-Y1090]
MTDKDFEEPIDGVPGDEGSEARASGPDSHGGAASASAAPAGDAEGDAAAEADAELQGEAEDIELTIDDILAAVQSDEAAGADGAAGVAAAGEDNDLLVDLKRLQAEYANYRRRTEDQRELEIERAKGTVAKGLLPVLDDLDRAEKHGDLVEGTALSAIAEKLRGIVTRLGVERYGAAGETFDPQQHEAIFQAPTAGTTEPTILEVVEVGYRLGTTELRPAKVVVAVPTE